MDFEGIDKRFWLDWSGIGMGAQGMGQAAFPTSQNRDVGHPAVRIVDNWRRGDMAVLLDVSEMIISNRFVRTYLFGSKVRHG